MCCEWIIEKHESAEERAEDKSALEKSSQSREREKGRSKSEKKLRRRENFQRKPLLLSCSKSISFLVEFRNVAEDSKPHSPSLSLPLAKLRSMQPEGAIIIRWLGDEMMGRKAATKHTNTQTHFCNSISCFNDGGRIPKQAELLM